MLHKAIVKFYKKLRRIAKNCELLWTLMKEMFWSMFCKRWLLLEDNYLHHYSDNLLFSSNLNLAFDSSQSKLYQVNIIKRNKDLKTRGLSYNRVAKINHTSPRAKYIFHLEMKSNPQIFLANYPQNSFQSTVTLHH